LRESTGADAAEVVRSHLLTREVFGFPALWRDIEALDNAVADEAQADMLIEAGRLSALGSTWFLRSRHLHDDMAGTIGRFAPGVAAIADSIWSLLGASAVAAAGERATRFEERQVPSELARRV